LLNELWPENARNIGGNKTGQEHRNKTRTDSHWMMSKKGGRGEMGKFTANSSSWLSGK